MKRKDGSCHQRQQISKRGVEKILHPEKDAQRYGNVLVQIGTEAFEQVF